MVTRRGVTLLLITLLSFSDGKRNFEETFRNCPESMECVHKSDCEHYNQRYAEYRRTKNKEIVTELKSLVCNKEKKAVCCRQGTLFSCDSQNSCGKPQQIPESVKNSVYMWLYSRWAHCKIALVDQSKKPVCASILFDLTWTHWDYWLQHWFLQCETERRP